MNNYGGSNNYSGYNYQDSGSADAYPATEGAVYGSGWDTQVPTQNYGYSQSYSVPPKVKNTSLFKTQLCRHFQAKGYCNMGENCSFAHGESELREGSSAGATPAAPVSTYGYSYSQPTPQYGYTHSKSKRFSFAYT